MKRKDFEVFEKEFKAYTASVVSAHAARKILLDQQRERRARPVLTAMGKLVEQKQDPWQGIPLLVSRTKIAGEKPNLDNEVVEWAMEKARQANALGFFEKLGRSLREKSTAEPDALGLFLVACWVEIPFWREGDKPFPGLMCFGDEDIGMLFTDLMPKSLIKKDKRKSETASPRAVKDKISTLKLVRYPYMNGKLHYPSGGGPPYFTFKPKP